MTATALQRVFVDVLGLTDDPDWETLAYRSTPAWDSVAHLQLVDAIEATFGVQLTEGDIVAIVCYPTAVEVLAGHGVSDC